MANKTPAIILAIVTLLSTAISADEKHISVYSPVAVYTVPLLERGGRDYIGLLELLEPLGRVSSESEGAHWGLRYNAIAAEFVAGRTRARIHGHDFDLPAPFLIEHSRGFIPLSSLNDVLHRFLGGPVDFRDGPRRLFIGGVNTQVSFQLDSNAPPRLALNFTAPVNPTISTEPGRLRMIFKRDPLVSPGSQQITFDNKIITQASYSENNGDAEIDIAASAPLIATFTNNRKTIAITPVPGAAADNNVAGARAPSTTNPSAAPEAPPTPPAPVVRRVLAVVDAAHGGEERGAALTETIAEKTVTLGFARLLRHELELRGFAVALPRDADTTLTLDQRAAAANVARAGIFIDLHAVSQGTGVGVYTALLPVEGASNGVFQPWNAAQASALPVSRVVAAAIVSEMQKREFSVRSTSVSLRPLNNVFMPAVAVELAPGGNGIDDLISANYQQRAASAIADAVASIRDRLALQ
jgi:N-acetylmuramoyl-L-alanine amidase